MRLRYKRILILLFLIITIVIVLLNIFDKEEIKEKVMPNLVNTSIKNLEIISSYNLNIKYEYDYNDEIKKDNIISQNIKSSTILKENDELILTVSLGKIDKEALAKDKVNELGRVPIMMYHGIVDKKNSETSYVGGNVDKDGYTRTTEAFRDDLEFYYKNSYRMIRLADYVEGNIDVEYGKSPIVITFDDGNANNIKVTGLDSNGDIIIDENSAVGILESFKKKYPSYHVTATFFITNALFNQKEYNEKILAWLVENGYDIGNHTYGHNNLSTTSILETQKVIANMYKKLDSLLYNKYVKIIALPFGAPYNKSNDNFKYVINGTYQEYTYNTKAALRVGWEPEVSPYDKNFDRTYMKRCRAYDNNGKEFDIQMVFNNLSNNRYISDGNKNTITVPNSKKGNIGNYNKKIITY